MLEASLMGRMKNLVVFAACTLTFFGWMADAENQVESGIQPVALPSGSMCVVDVALLDLDGPNYGLDDLCVAAKDKATVVVRCTSGSRYSSQATLNPCLSKRPMVSLQYDTQGLSNNVSLLMWLNVPHDVLDSAMYALPQHKTNLFSAHTVVGDLNYTRFHLAIAQRCVGNIKTMPEQTSSKFDDVTPTDNDVMGEKTPPNHRTQIEGVLTERHRRETDPTHLSASITTPLADGVPHGTADVIPIGESVIRVSDFAERIDATSVKDYTNGNLASILTNGGTPATTISAPLTDSLAELEEATSSGEGAQETTNYSVTTFNVYDITSDVIPDITSDISNVADVYGFPTPDATNDITAAAAGNPRRPSDADVLMGLLSKSRENSVLPTNPSSSSVFRSPYTLPSTPEPRVTFSTQAPTESSKYFPSSSVTWKQTESVDTAAISRATPTFLRADDLFQDLGNPLKKTSFIPPTASPRTPPLPTASPSTDVPTEFSDVVYDVHTGNVLNDEFNNGVDNEVHGDVNNGVDDDVDSSYNIGAGGNLVIEARRLDPEPPADDDFYDDVTTVTDLDTVDVEDEVQNASVPFSANVAVTMPPITALQSEGNIESNNTQQTPPPAALDSADFTHNAGTTVVSETTLLAVPRRLPASDEPLLGNVSSLGPFSDLLPTNPGPEESSKTVPTAQSLPPTSSSQSMDTSKQTLPPKNSSQIIDISKQTMPPTSSSQSTDTTKQTLHPTSSSQSIDTSKQTVLPAGSSQSASSSLQTPSPASSSHSTVSSKNTLPPTVPNLSTLAESTVQTDRVTDSIEKHAETVKDNTPFPTESVDLKGNTTDQESKTINSTIDNGGINISSTTELENGSNVNATRSGQNGSHSNNSNNNNTPSGGSNSNSTSTTDSTKDNNNAASSQPTPFFPNTPSPGPENLTVAFGSRGNSSSLSVPPEEEEVESDTFWPIVAALVIGIPSIIVFGIAITVIHKRRLASPARLRAASMYPSLNMSPRGSLHVGHRSSIDV